MPEKVTGYQYGDDLSYIGIYVFDNNADQKSIHLPPKTTLIPPPSKLPAGKQAFFNEESNKWFVRDADISWMDPDSRAKYLNSLES